MLGKSAAVIFGLVVVFARRFGTDGREAIPRCCREGSVLRKSGNSTYACAAGGGNNGEVGNVDSGLTDGMPVCGIDGEYQSRPLEGTDLTDAGIPGGACVDVPVGGFPEVNRPVVLSCSDDGTSSDRLRVPSYLEVRRCCPLGERFLTETRSCAVIDEPDVEIPAISLMKSFARIDYVFEMRGLSGCEGAIFDYVVNSSDVSLNVEKLELTLSLSNDEESLSINEKNSCLDVGNDPGLLVVRACRDLELCRRIPCLRKCCPEDEAQVANSCTKKPSDLTLSKWHQTVWEMAENTTTNEEIFNTTDYGLIVGKPCKFGMYPVLPTENWRLAPKGGLDVPGYRTYDHHEYCTELGYNSSLFEDGFYPFVCFEEAAPESIFSKERFKVNAILLCISSVFLLVTLLVYVCLPTLRNLHGRTLMCQVASFLVADVCLAIIAVASPTASQLDTDTNTEGVSSTILCAFLGYAAFFSVMSAFFWLNVMCFDIWWTFSSMRHTDRSNAGRREETKRFLYYCLYAWGSSLLMTLVALGSDLSNFLPKYLTPGIGFDSCWFRNGLNYYAEVLFFIGPLAIQILVNMVFFVLTARRCNMVQEEIERRIVINRTDPKRRRFKADKSKFILNTKLFTVMGVSWVFEVVSYFLNHYDSHLQWKEELFYISDALNALQGVFIFFLFVAKKKVWRALKERLGWKSAQHPNNTGVHDPFRVKKSVSSSTLMTTFAASTPS